MRRAKQPDPPPPRATAAPCVCDHCRLVACTVSLSSGHFGIAQLLWRRQIAPPPLPPPPPPPKRYRVHRSVLWHHKY